MILQAHKAEQAEPIRVNPRLRRLGSHDESPTHHRLAEASTLGPRRTL